MGGGLHVGVLYMDEDEELRLAHMQWHLELCSADEPAGVKWVAPSLSPDDLEAIAQQCQLLRRKARRAQIPSALARRDAVIREGRLELRSARGLNCATLVLLIFEAAGIVLLDRLQWERPSPERAAQDRRVQEELVEALAREHPGPAEHLKVEIGSPRIRPEEVAAASGLSPSPGAIQDCRPEWRCPAKPTLRRTIAKLHRPAQNRPPLLRRAALEPPLRRR
jgi:hypothetical protein